MSWKIHREMAVVLGWGRAILLQVAHPLVARGVADHSGFRTEPWGRLRRLHGTFDAMLRMTFGTAEDAAHVAGAINAIHDRVHGRLEEPAGAFPPGTPYWAHDPALLSWVHATLVESHLLAFELYVGPLAPEEKDRYCLETSGIERLLGILEGALPRSGADLQAYIRRRLGSGEIQVTETARALAREIVLPPTAGVAAPLFWFMRLPTVGLLPPAIRDAYGFPWDGRHEQALRLSARLARAVLPLVPSPLRHWPSARAAFRARGRLAPP